MRKRFAVAVLMAWFALPAIAHDARPVFIQIAERSDGTLDVQWRVPKLASMPAHPKLSIGSIDVAEHDVVRAALPGSTMYTARVRVSEPLAGQRIWIRYPTVNPGLSTLLQVTISDGTAHTQLLSPGETSWLVPVRELRTSVASQYVGLGVRHIFEGLDHLLFIACLLLLAGTLGRALLTITGFTIAHSITLALATLDVVHVPTAPVEVAIALSILFVAREILIPSESSYMRRYPIAVSSLFGLLHGFGFASVLTDIGLPANDVPTALLGFNIGVELGQIAFVTAAWLGLMLFRRSLRHQALQPLRVSALYAVGTVSAYWIFDRVSSF